MSITELLNLKVTDLILMPVLDHRPIRTDVRWPKKEEPPEPRTIPAHERYRDAFDGKVRTISQLTKILGLKEPRGVNRTVRKLQARGLVAERPGIRVGVHGKIATRWEWVGP